MTPYVTGASIAAILRPATRVDRAARFVAGARISFVHSGQSTPTAEVTWQSPQIVRPHRWQSAKLRTPGCR
ncbi:hypothetical protein [Leucobacter manosquensis]|uniref:hypothetical protein n=1 Tax=Leucobacter manosquensis TaxID=2810611 RepID=UPI00201618A3|nr:hypothetical protein [Leucobacter manosquensis]